MSRTFDALVKAGIESETRKRRNGQKRAGVSFNPLSVFKDKRHPVKIDFDLDPFVEEQYHRLRLHLLPNSKRPAIQVVMVAATDHGEGGTTTAAILASTLARSVKSKILLVDANLRTPALNEVFEPGQSYKLLGLSDKVLSEIPLDQAIYETDKPNLFFMPCGRAVSSPSYVFDNELMGAMLPALRERFDFVIFDGSPLSFDIAVEEIFPTLISGATVVLHSPRLCFPDVDFLRWAEQEQITILDLATGFWHAWVYALAASEKSLPANLRLVVVGGEQASAEAFTIWQGIAAEKVRWMNTYGPTEATVGTLFYEPGRENEAGGDSRKIPIGRPLANTQTYILDSHLQPVPIGVAGEIYLGGVCLARGYLNRPELTAARFIANPFSDEPGARLYRTGDLARHMPDGNIEFLGRVDNQLKLRGFRIELEEIETVLGQHPGVRDAVVLVREDTPDTQRLVAYIVPKQDFVSTKELVMRRDSDAKGSTTEATMVPRQMPTHSAADLRSFLGKKLPDYMVPTAFVMLGALPLTPNGKVDRRALPAPDQTRPAAEENFVAPRTPIEVLLAKIWANLFKLERVGAHDNFFDLGGHSLLAVRLMDQIERRFGKKLSLAALFQGPTIENLAKLISQNVALPKWSFLVPLQPHGSKPPFFWVHGENSDAFLPRYLGPEQPLYGLRHQSEDGQPALYATVVDIAAHYCREIRSVQSRGPYFLGGYCFGAVVAFEIAQQLEKQNHAVALLILIEPDNPRIVEAPAQPRSGIRRQLRVGTSWLDEVNRHRQKLASLKASEKAHYIFERAKGKTKEIAINIASPVQKFLQRTAYKAHLALGYPIPVSLRSRYILDIYARAMDEYAPKVSSDRLVIFKATDECEPDRWEKLAGGGIEIHEIHGDHTNILNEPHIRSWASLLKEQIDRAQSRTTPREDTPPVSFTESAPNAFVTEGREFPDNASR